MCGYQQSTIFVCTLLVTKDRQKARKDAMAESDYKKVY